MDSKGPVVGDSDRDQMPERGPSESDRRATEVRKALIRASHSAFEYATKKLDEADTLMRASDHIAGIAARGSDVDAKRLLDTLLSDVPGLVPS